MNIVPRRNYELFWWRYLLKSSLPQILKAMRVIPKYRRKKLMLISVIQSSLGLLDLVGIALVGIIGALSVSGIKSSHPGENITQILSLLRINNFSFQNQIAILGVIASTFLVLKTILSGYLNTRILKFLSLNSSMVATNMYKELLSNPLIMLDGSSSQRTLYSVSQGVQSLILGAIGSLVNVASEFFLFLILFLALLIFDSVLALGTLLLFGIGAGALYLRLHKRARQLGVEHSDLSVSLNELFIESQVAYRELFVRNQLGNYWQDFKKKREDLAINTAQAAFMPMLSKYAVEISLVVGALLITALQFSRGSAEEAATSLGVFFATSSRLAPSILRMQQSLISIKISLSESNVTLELLDQLNRVSGLDLISETDSEMQQSHSSEEFQAEVKVSHLSAKYGNSQKHALVDVSFEVPKGSFTAIVGPSGAGKSTLADCILGIMVPCEGNILISDRTPLEAIKCWPEKIAYVPQQSYLARRSVYQNVTFNFGFRKDEEGKVWQALLKANAKEFVENLPSGVHTGIGERGSQLSGGQRQRIGIARALFTSPQLLVLDEATSALDSLSEKLITESLILTKGKSTLIVIAHRLSTVRLADQIIYMEAGQVKQIGKFDDLYSSNSAFASQVNAMNLS